MNWLKQEWNKLKGLSAKQKIEYIWDYYKLWLIGLVSLVLVSGYLLDNYKNANKEINIYVAFVNTFADIGEGSAFWKGYAEENGIDTNSINITFDTNNYFDMTQNNVTGNHYYEKLVVVADSEMLDAVVLEPENLAALGSGGRLIDLRDKRTDELMHKYADRIITTEYTDENGTVCEIPVGIDISDSILVTKEAAYDRCALGISANTQHVEAVEAFLSYILEEEEE
ncbi:hypothetical protein [Butyricicoccus sp.]|mgnify:FL=1|uniref:hypothetical protein n=1 Tax=Butyricicoccus sp. TaxID=2049021 RepID=UPI003F1667D7